MTDTTDIDEQLRRSEGADDHSTSSSAKVEHHGLSEQALVPLLYAAIGIGVLGLVAALIVGLVTMTQIGTVSATAGNAVNVSIMAERNAKLAQYQLEETLKRHNLEVPHE